MKNNYKAVIMLVAFVCCHMFIRSLWGDSWTATLLEIDGQTYVLQSLCRWLFIYGPFVLFTLCLFRDEPLADLLGVRFEKAGYYCIAALLCCLPMIVGYAYLSQEVNLSLSDIVTGSIYPALFEEIVFRAILFGLLFRVCNWGFIPSAIVSSLIFGVGHLYQSHDLGSAIMLMAFMAVAGSWFAWLYCECEYRIWFPMWMHLFMNAAYGVFNMSGGAVGEANANIFRAITIILSLVFVYIIIRNGKPREVTKTRLLKGHSRTESTLTAEAA